MTAFSAALRSATWADHREAERSAYLDALLAGQLTRDGYAAMVAQHYFAYAVLEEIAEAMRDDPVAAPFAHDGLTRMPALVADLEFLLGDDWPDRIAASASTREYCARMRAASHDWPGGFVAHHYTRYLGDLSGGQYIASAVEQIYGLPDRSGVRFYDFDAIGDLALFKARYRHLLDTAPWDENERHRITAEVSAGYRLNAAVLTELGDDLARYAA